MDAVSAAEELRWGVVAFHRGHYNNAILSFEKSLSYKPENPLVRVWLGRAYYKSGLEETALSIWGEVAASGEGSPLLDFIIETIEARRGIDRELQVLDQFVELYSVAGRRAQYDLFLRPTSVNPFGIGGFIVCAYGSNEVLAFNANGARTRTIQGSFEGLDHPFDLVTAPNGYLYITEFNGDRITRCRPDGTDIFTFGERGLGPGQLLGPQYIDVDTYGYLYVSDLGNRRISKFDEDGEFVHAFGGGTDGYEGLLSPSGVTIRGETLVVADQIRGDLSVFDLNGNFLGVMAGGLLSAPEGIVTLHDDTLLIADSSRVVTYDPETERLTVLADFSGTNSRVTKAAVDLNGNILVSDLEGQRIIMLAPRTSMYTGFFVRIDRVISDEFPLVTVDVSVQDRYGEPYVGLSGNNFFVTENRGSVEQPEFLFTGDTAEGSDIALLIERSDETEALQDELQYAAEEVYRAHAGRGSIFVVTAGTEAVVETGKTPALGTVRNAVTETGAYGPQWRFDLGLRMATTELLQNREFPSIVMLSSGEMPADAFSTYRLVELAQYLRNNGIGFYCVYLQDGVMTPEYEYLCEETGGRSYYLYRPEGIAGIVRDIRSRKMGTYVLQYTSRQDSDFGNAYLPVEVEVFLFNKSGRDESGYYAPLDF